jgi:hypothetical protein
MAEVMTVTAKFVLNAQQFKAGLNQATAQARDSARRISTRMSDAAKRVRGSFASMAKSIRSNLTAILASLTAVGFALNKIAQDIDRLAKFSRRLGVPVAVLQQLESVAGKSGVSVAELSTALEFFQKSTAEAIEGTGPLADRLRLLGVNIDEFVQLPLIERIELIADRMAAMSSDVEKTGLAVDAFGRSGQRMIIMLDGGSKAIRQLRDDFAEVGGVISDEGAANVEAMNDAFQRLMESAKATGQAITVAIAGPLKQVLDFLTAFTTELRTSRIPVLFTGIGPTINRFRQRRQVERERSSGSATAALNPTIPTPTNPIGATQDSIGQVSTFFGTFKTGERDQLRLLDQIRKATQDTVSAIRNQRGELT